MGVDGGLAGPKGVAGIRQMEWVERVDLQALGEGAGRYQTKPTGGLAKSALQCATALKHA